MLSFINLDTQIKELNVFTEMTKYFLVLNIKKTHCYFKNLDF